jgi:hypothetical protein
MKNKVLLTLIILSGFGREFVMVNINWIKKHITEGAPSYAQDLFNPLLLWSPQNIENLKWVLTIFFTLFFFLLTYALLKNIYPTNKQYHRITIIVYLMIIVASAFVYLIGLLIGVSNEVYTTVRTLMGIGQSFVPLMVLYLLFRFMPNLDNKKQA